MRTLSYGEDGLTYWGLSQRLDQFLLRLSDQSDPGASLFIFRPSFGRNGGMSAASFGEFDAIVATKECVYLVETKWDGSSSVIGDVPVLAPRQVLRHRIFRWIRDRWTSQNPPDWPTFYRSNHAEFELVWRGKPLAPAGSRLASNLEFYLQSLGKYPAGIQDVLLYFHRAGRPFRAESAAALDFKVVAFVYQPLNAGGVFDPTSGVQVEA